MKSSLSLTHTAGADVEKADVYGNTPLLVAADSGRRACVERLLEAGADKDAQSADGETALHTAADAEDGHEAVVEVLLAAGCSVDLPSNNGTTPLIFFSL